MNADETHTLHRARADRRVAAHLLATLAATVEGALRLSGVKDDPYEELRARSPAETFRALSRTAGNTPKNPRAAEDAATFAAVAEVAEAHALTWQEIDAAPLIMSADDSPAANAPGGVA